VFGCGTPRPINRRKRMTASHRLSRSRRVLRTAGMGHERSSPLTKPTARFRGARDHFDVPHCLHRCEQDQSARTPPALSDKDFGLAPIRRAVARPRGGGDAQRTVRGHRAHAGVTIRCLAAGRRGVLTCLSRGTGVQVGAIFDVRALLTPPLAAERMVRLSTR
jgi:hypothetical protein